jgi:hypothetical protein
MKFNKIVAFGDSWIWGDELLDPALANHPQAHPVLMENTKYRESHCFLGLLGAHYGVPTENFGWPGGSDQSAMWCYLWWLEHEPNPEQCLILVGHTDANRTSFYNPNHVSYANDPPWNRFVHSSWVHAGNSANTAEWQDMVKRYTVLSDCAELHQLTFKQSVLFFHGQSQNNVLQFCTIPPCMNFQCDTLLWPDRSIGKFLFEHPDRSTLFAPMRHPNEKGHAVIRDHLITEIDRVILA